MEQNPDLSSEIPDEIPDDPAVVGLEDVTTRAGFVAWSRKAFAAALAAGSAAAVPALTAALADNVFDWSVEFWPIATAVLGFGLVAFIGTWSVPNAD